MNIRILTTAAILGALGMVSAPAATGDTPAAAAGTPQSRCFCVQYTGGLPPYYIGRLMPPAPECAALKYAPNGKSPLEDGLLSCDSLRKCLKGSAQYEKKKKILHTKTSQAKLRQAGCCAYGKGIKNPGAPCDSKCVSDWTGILKVLAAATEKLDKEEQQARELCFSRARKAEEKGAGGNGAGN